MIIIVIDPACRRDFYKYYWNAGLNIVLPANTGKIDLQIEMLKKFQVVIDQHHGERISPFYPNQLDDLIDSSLFLFRKEREREGGEK